MLQLDVSSYCKATNTQTYYMDLMNTCLREHTNIC